MRPNSFCFVSFSTFDCCVSAAVPKDALRIFRGRKMRNLRRLARHIFENASTGEVKKAEEKESVFCVRTNDLINE